MPPLKSRVKEEEERKDCLIVSKVANSVILTPGSTHTTSSKAGLSNKRVIFGCDNILLHKFLCKVGNIRNGTVFLATMAKKKLNSMNG